jgi:hypothetical protein|nr:MAG TPA: hypothetical protein [Caudoviricetes sp.]
MTKETMTIHKGLAELKILNSRIYNTVALSTFCKENIHSNQKIDGVSIDEYKKTIVSGYDKSNDLIKRAIAIKRAITNSNAVTHLKDGFEEYTVAEAIYMKQHGITLKESLLQEMKDQYAKACNKINKMNGDSLAEDAKKYVTGIYGSKEGKTNTEEYERTRKAYIEAHTYELIDPIHIKDKIDELEDEISKFKAGIDAALSVSNATTEITVEY